MKKLLLSVLLCILSIAANVDAAHALNPYTIIRDAKNGQASSQFLLGLLYTTGAESEVIEVDPHKAREWYEKAALQGHAVAQLALASIYEQGDNVERDIEKAKMWYEKAALQGAASAQLRMGEFYEKGVAVEQDFAKAMDWYKQAALQNSAEAKSKLEALQKKMATEQAAQPQAPLPKADEK